MNLCEDINKIIESAIITKRGSEFVAKFEKFSFVFSDDVESHEEATRAMTDDGEVNVENGYVFLGMGLHLQSQGLGKLFSSTYSVEAGESNQTTGTPLKPTSTVKINGFKTEAALVVDGRFPDYGELRKLLIKKDPTASLELSLSTAPTVRSGNLTSDEVISVMTQWISNVHEITGGAEKKLWIVAKDGKKKVTYNLAVPADQAIKGLTK